MNDPNTIVAISTPPGEGGIGVVRLSGPESIAIGRKVFHCTPPLGSRIRFVEYGRVMVDGRAIDEGLAWVLAAPRSYTGEDTVEISSHGSFQILEQLVQAALAKGAVLAQPGEFTRRAFLNGRLDLLQAEAVVDLIQAGGKGSLDNAYGHLQGRLSALVRQHKSCIIEALSLIEVGLDFAEEDIDETSRQSVLNLLDQVINSTRHLVDTFEGCRLRQDGALVALVGRPNVGKSTLLNAFLGEERAIVTPLPGTTRDLIEGRAHWGGEIIRLVDSAGIRISQDLIEKEGIRRAIETIETADFVLAVLDASDNWHKDDELVLQLLENKPAILLLNKTDLPRRLNIPIAFSSTHPVVDISALTGLGLPQVQNVVAANMPSPSLVNGLGITRQRHRDCLQRVIESSTMAREMLLSQQLDECIVAELQEGLVAFGDILGENVADDVLDRIFSDFCIGK